MTSPTREERAQPTHCLRCGQPRVACSCTRPRRTRAANELSVEESRRVMDGAISEKQFQANVVRQAREWGWWVHHETIAYRSGAGMPDLTLVRGSRIVYAELKTMRGKVTPSQAEVIALLMATGKVEAYIWRPDAWEEIGRVLAP